MTFDFPRYCVIPEKKLVNFRLSLLLIVKLVLFLSSHLNFLASGSVDVKFSWV